MTPAYQASRTAQLESKNTFGGCAEARRSSQSTHAPGAGNTPGQLFFQGPAPLPISDAAFLNLCAALKPISTPMLDLADQARPRRTLLANCLPGTTDSPWPQKLPQPIRPRRRPRKVNP